MNRIVYKYQWIDMFIGIAGNCFFIAGSVLFLYQTRPISIYCFIAGSTSMLIGRLGSVTVKLCKAKVEREAAPALLIPAIVAYWRTSADRYA